MNSRWFINYRFVWCANKPREYHHSDRVPSDPDAHHDGDEHPLDPKSGGLQEQSGRVFVGIIHRGVCKHATSISLFPDEHPKSVRNTTEPHFVVEIAKCDVRTANRTENPPRKVFSRGGIRSAVTKIKSALL